MKSVTHTGEEYLSRFNWSTWAAVFLTTGEVSAQRGMYAITLSPNFSSSRVATQQELQVKQINKYWIILCSLAK